MARPAKASLPSDKDLLRDQESAHDAWFRSEVEAGLREADDPNTEWIANEDIERRGALNRAAWKSRTRAGLPAD